MATSLFFIPTEQNSGETRREQPQKTSCRGRKPGSKTGQQNQKKQRLRGMGVAQLEEHIKAEEEKKMGADTPAPPNRLPDPPVVVLQGFPSYGGGSRLFCAGGSGHQIMIDPVWGFYDTSSTHELSSIPNHPPPPPHQIYNTSSITHCDSTCFKKKRLDGDQNVARSNGGGFPKYTMNGYDQRSHGFFYDHRIARSAPASVNPYFNEAKGSVEEFGSGNPRNGVIKEYYEFFPGKYDKYPGGKYVKSEPVATSLGDCSPHATTSTTIDLSLKL